MGIKGWKNLKAIYNFYLPQLSAIEF